MLRLLVSACFVLVTGVAQSAVITIDPTRSGRFGSDSGQISGSAMVGFTVPGAALFTISATGSLCLVPDFACTLALTVGSPDGILIDSSTAILPIEEKTGINLNPNENAGALIGAFVPAGTLGTSGLDEDESGNVAAAALFLIGAGPFSFSAPGIGTLYFGINDSFAGNNSGAGFTVTINEVTPSAVPEPSTLMLLGFGVIAYGAARRRRR